MISRFQDFASEVVLNVLACFIFSMGGAVAVHVASRKLIPSLIGLAVIDVVEGVRSLPPDVISLFNVVRLF